MSVEGLQESVPRLLESSTLWDPWQPSSARQLGLLPVDRSSGISVNLLFPGLRTGPHVESNECWKWVEGPAPTLCGLRGAARTASAWIYRTKRKSGSE